MALTRKFLTAMGVEPEKIDEIINAHIETVDAIKGEKETYRKEAERLANVESELETMKAAANENNSETWKVKYDALKEEFETYKTDVTSKETKATKESAYKQLLKDAGVSEKRIDAVMKVSASTIDALEFDKEGKIKNADTLAETVKTEWSDFIVTQQQQGAQTSNPPQNNAAKSYTKEDLKGMTAAEINANWDAIKQSLKQ